MNAALDAFVAARPDQSPFAPVGATNLPQSWGGTADTCRQPVARTVSSTWVVSSRSAFTGRHAGDIVEACSSRIGRDTRPVFGRGIMPGIVNSEHQLLGLMFPPPGCGPLTGLSACSSHGSHDDRIQSPTDREYFRSRALDEHARAEAATDRLVAQLHLELAERYERLVVLSSDEPKRR